MVTRDDHPLKLADIPKPEPQEGIHHEAGPVNPKKVFYSMTAADAMGRIRKIR